MENCKDCGTALAECEFKTRPICRLYTLCIRQGYGNKENNINNCALYWRLKVDRAIKRLMC